MKKILTILLSLSFFTVSLYGKTKKVLFIGNSYTYVNDLPQIVASIAAAMGDTLIFDSETAGGATLDFHAHFNPATINKIQQGNWDHVVLQEQSQSPSFPTSQVEAGVYPPARFLDSLIDLSSPCGRTMFYMTWGRQNGDAGNCPSWPYVCTYEGMDSLIRARYMTMADMNQAVISPVGAVWHYIRHNYPAIGLYQADESHPSTAGSYAAACSFYATIFRKNPELIPYNYSIDPTQAAQIRTAARMVAYDSLIYWHIGEYDPKAGFTPTIGTGNQVSFANTSTNATDYLWDFGDGQTSILTSPSHTYAGVSNYTVTLIASRCGVNDTLHTAVSLFPAGITGEELQGMFTISPNPTNSAISLHASSPLSGTYSIQILDMTGRLVSSRRSSLEKDERIDLSGLSANTYLLLIGDGEKTISRFRIVKNQ